MPPRPDHIPTAGQQRPARVTKDDQQRIRRIRIAALILALGAILVLISLLSYTARDEANAQMTLRDMMGVIRGDEALRVRFETTNNWAGLLGAVISHWMYTSTIGVWSICVPVLMLLWAYDLYRFQRITPLITKRSIATLGTGVLVAALVGTLQLMSWFSSIDRLWVGAIGQFIAGVSAQFIGTLGSALVFLVATSFAVVYGFDVSPARVAVRSLLLRTRLNDWVRERGLRRQGAQEGNEYADETDELMYDDASGQKPNEPEDSGDIETYITPQPRITRPVADAGTFLRGAVVRPNAPAEDGPIELSGSVRILRPTGKIPPPPVGAPPTSGHPTQGTPLGSGIPPQGPPSSSTGMTTSNVDFDAVQQRLKALHPNREVTLRKDIGPIDPGDPPELPLFLQEDEAEVEGPIELPPGIGIVRPLNVVVGPGAPPEQEVHLKSTMLYDEHITYKPPSGSLLNGAKEETGVTDEELRDNARILQDKLETFRIKIENLTVQPGPVVTQYEFVPAAGIKVSQIEALADDIALALKAQGVRIIAPIPGRGTVGIEIPNHNPAVVRFSSIIKSPKYHNPDIKLPIAMGKTVIGEVYCADLTKMPHLLIAGATGKGKSVGINTIIASLLYKMHPRDLKFVIIDPKRVEMTLYALLKNHFMAVCPDIDETIVTSPTNAVIVLKSLVEEMQQRFSILAASGQRNILDYNRKVHDGTLTDKGGFTHRPIPYIVVIIDELADLMMTAGKEVEEPICRLAQLARAVGIHCIVATQRPSVDVVTGLIKANFPARIAYQVASRIDSRTILDTSGAEHLIGNGDMLFSPGTTPKPIRMQNAFISTEEVEAICEAIGKQKGYSTPYMLPSVSNKRGAGMSGDSDDRDQLFEDAARIFITLQQASVSTLQRRLKVGYARAARIVDELEMAGIVGPPDGSRGRSVLLQSEAELEAYL